MSRPEDGATQTLCSLAATEPRSPGATVPIVVLLETVLNRGSICLTATKGFDGVEPTTQTASLDVATPVGVSSTGSVRMTVRLAASTLETLWSSRLATQSDPEPAAIAAGLAPTGTWSTTSFECGSMIATAFSLTFTPPPPPPWPKANTGIATAAARTPIRAEPAYMRRRLRRSSTSSVLSWANSVCRPSTTSW